MPTCYKCHKSPAPGMLCDHCRPTSPLTALQVVNVHDGIAKQLVHRLKFERAIAAAKPIARSMAALLPSLFHGADNVCITSVPTASSRIRARGYDQAACLARYIAKECNLPYRAVLGRLTQTRQVGASRAQRITQLEEAFYVRNNVIDKIRVVILVDDVMTTGSSLDACATALRKAGVQKVFGLVFARQM